MEPDEEFILVSKEVEGQIDPNSLLYGTDSSEPETITMPTSLEDLNKASLDPFVYVKTQKLELDPCEIVGVLKSLYFIVDRANNSKLILEFKVSIATMKLVSKLWMSTLKEIKIIANGEEIPIESGEYEIRIIKYSEISASTALCRMIFAH